MRSLLLCLFFLGCTRDKIEIEENPIVPYEQVADRLMRMLDDGWVVTRGTEGIAEDLGDSLIFTGLAMGSLDCERGKTPEAALLKMLEVKEGGVYRHPSIPNDYSLDGLLGLWWGIGERIRRCPESKESWAKVLPRHKAKVSVEPFFHVALDQVMADLGVGDAPSADERGKIGAEVAGWAIGVVTQRAAAFRLHLGYLSLSMVDAPKGKAAYCTAVKDAQIALIERFCGRTGLSAWVTNFSYNRYVYAFQRAAWEEEHVTDKTVTPGVDMLMAYSALAPR